MMTQYLKWACSESRDPFLNFGAHHIFGVKIDTDEYWRTMIDYSQSGDVQRDLFNFCEIIDNISETVQERDVYTMED